MDDFKIGDRVRETSSGAMGTIEQTGVRVMAVGQLGQWDDNGVYLQLDDGPFMACERGFLEMAD